MTSGKKSKYGSISFILKKIKALTGGNSKNISENNSFKHLIGESATSGRRFYSNENSPNSSMLILSSIGGGSNSFIQRSFLELVKDEKSSGILFDNQISRFSAIPAIDFLSECGRSQDIVFVYTDKDGNISPILNALAKEPAGRLHSIIASCMRHHKSENAAILSMVLRSILGVLCSIRDHHNASFTIQTIIDYLSYEKIIEIINSKSFDKSLKAGLVQYIEMIGGKEGSRLPRKDTDSSLIHNEIFGVFRQSMMDELSQFPGIFGESDARLSIRDIAKESKIAFIFYPIAIKDQDTYFKSSSFILSEVNQGIKDRDPGAHFCIAMHELYMFDKSQLLNILDENNGDDFSFIGSSNSLSLLEQYGGEGLSSIASHCGTKLIMRIEDPRDGLRLFTQYAEPSSLEKTLEFINNNYTFIGHEGDIEAYEFAKTMPLQANIFYGNSIERVDLISNEILKKSWLTMSDDELDKYPSKKTLREIGKIKKLVTARKK